MARFEIAVGQPGMGKSLYTASVILYLVERNKSWFEKTGVLRQVAVNMVLAQEFLHFNKNFIVFWSSWDDLLKLKDVDVVWDEISIMLDARKFADLNMSQLHWLSHYRKLGLEIYANTQDYTMLDRRARIMATKVYGMLKLLGSSDPSPTRPPIRRLWGIVLLRELLDHRDEKSLSEPKYALFPSGFLLIRKKYVSIYDTRQIIEVKERPLEHRVRSCLVCGKVHVTHS